MHSCLTLYPASSHPTTPFEKCQTHMHCNHTQPNPPSDFTTTSPVTCTLIFHLLFKPHRHLLHIKSSFQSSSALPTQLIFTTGRSNTAASSQTAPSHHSHPIPLPHPTLTYHLFLSVVAPAIHPIVVAFSTPASPSVYHPAVLYTAETGLPCPAHTTL